VGALLAHSGRGAPSARIAMHVGAGFKPAPKHLEICAKFAQNCAPLAAHVRFTIWENTLLYTTSVSLSRTFFTELFSRFIFGSSICLLLSLSQVFEADCCTEICSSLSQF
jgi:hypothetical protein